MHQLTELRELGLGRQLREVDSAQGAEVVLEGEKLVNFSSNDYLGLAAHPVLREAAIKAVEKYGAGSGASRLISGNLLPHVELEAALAKLKGTEAALSFSSGYAAAVGIVSCLAGRDDVVVLDKLAHACLIDAARLSGAKIRIYPHNNLEKLDAILRWAKRDQEGSHRNRRVLIITESVFSMDGDLAPLKDIADLAEKYGAWLMVDEAHATGLFGEKRAGLAEAFEMPERINIHFGTLGKALGSAGGYVCGSKTLIEFLINRCRSFIFSTAPVPAASAAARAAVDLLGTKEGLQRQERVWALVDHLKSGLITAGIQMPPTQSAIIPVILGDENRAVEVAAQLRAEGFYLPAIRYPTVGLGKARLRISITASNTVDQIQRLCAVMAKAVQPVSEGASVK